MGTLANLLTTEPTSFWRDEDTCISIEQFTQIDFDLPSAKFAEHVLLLPFTGVFAFDSQASQKKHLLPLQAIFLVANSTHHIQTLKPCSLIAISFPLQYLTAVADRAENIGDWQSQIITSDPPLIDVLKLLDKEVATRDHHTDSALQNLLSYLSIHLVRNYSTIKTASATEPGRPEICQIMCALEYIEMNLTEEKSISDVVSQTHLSKHRFLETFKEVTGQSPQQFVISRRLDVARHLLRRHDLSLDQIAKQAGFVDQSHFSKTFRKHFGQTPAVFRGQ